MIWLLACAAADSAAEPEVDTCETGETAVWLVSSLTFSRELEEGVSAGFDFDGLTSTAGGNTGCGLADFTDPDGTPGVDNQFAVLLPVLEATEAQAIEGLIASAILAGELLLVLDLDHVDDTENDTCVDFTLGRAAGPPLVAADGALEWYQTLERDPAQPTSSTTGAFVDATMRAETLDLTLPISILGNDFVFEIPSGSLRFTVGDDGTVSGYFGGGLPITKLLEVVNTDNIDAALQELAADLVQANGDLDADSSGACQSLSITFQFTAIPAFLLDP